VKVARHAVQSGLWNLYEIYKGKLRFTVKMKERIPVGEYVKLQGRFGHLKDEQIELLQKYADEKYRELELMESKE
jgi:pyruvate/2-oxoacid:ferredoxin oxidoreductase beta subunit